MIGMGWRTKLMGICMACMGSTFVLTPQLYAFLNLDFWSIPKLQRQIEANEEITAEMERLNEIVNCRISKKEEYVRALQMGKLTFEETVDLFYDLNSLSPSCMELQRQVYYSHNDRLNSAISVVHYVQALKFTDRDAKSDFEKSVKLEFHRLFPVSPN